jgi:DNA-directed RNA polymerase specialized sigma subunit
MEKSIIDIENVEHKSSLKFFAHSMQKIKDNGVDTLTLVQMAQNGDVNAMEQLLARYHRVILSAYYKYRDFGGSMNESEILSACMDGFMQAINDYRGELKHRSFVGVLYNRVRTQISDMLAKIGKVISYNRTVLLRVKWINAMLSQGKSISEIAKKLNMSINQVVKRGGLNNQINAVYGDDELNKIVSISNEYEDKVDSLYEAIKLFVENPNLIAEYGAEGLSRVVDFYPQSVKVQLENLYKQL